jgi:hypothetical protein
MANDIAKKIWELAQKDANMDGLLLKEMFHKKVDIDFKALKTRLRDIISNHIKSNFQPCKSSITLSPDPTNPDFIIGANPSYIEKFSVPDKNIPKQYIYDKHNGRDQHYYEVQNIETMMLIDCAILPLGLKWRLDSHKRLLVVSWTHWMDESNQYCNYWKYWQAIINNTSPQ